ncbi:MAG: hypothetical protein CVU97_06015 [Firmicutes bacterium HGW-Firmicutes-21]|nr:MAG: hypothetical protein CVU97_06015 [Firmicutes bacterium HGW-Firmicutes-21]
MKNKQMCYKDEAKLSLLILGLRVFFEKRDYLVFRLWKEHKKARKVALATRESFLKNGKKYKGRIIKTDITAHDEDYGGRTKTKFEYYAIIEYKNEKEKSLNLQHLN